ncbi:hypothetical protein GCM10025868_06100 [Angustibacter aerolatus]|uniref:Tyrosine--tRNA ligase n=1 Tax=Angustibacter aerolatus TaxID=1162965 RepID=A0ABQ6JEW3_9ACTN|nr:hypothetical protein GCM10025868_06100 [Angustibacter aerolatus]
MHVLTTPLVTKADGTKFGKTEGGTVWLDPAMTSPYAFYQFWLNVEDASVLGYLRVFTDRGREQAGRPRARGSPSGPSPGWRSGRSRRTSRPWCTGLP